MYPEDGEPGGVFGCPACGLELFGGAALGSTIFGCGGCGGVWLDIAACQRVATAPGAPDAREAAGLARRAQLNAPNPGRDAPVPRACPVCTNAMSMTRAPRLPFGLDACAAHGTWFDAGELAEVIRVSNYKAPDRPLAAAAPPPRWTEPSAQEVAEFQAALRKGRALDADDREALQAVGGVLVSVLVAGLAGLGGAGRRR